jgi:mevalonate kinase
MKTSKVSTSETVKQTKLENQKRAKQFKQLLKIMNELNQDIYICVQDKKARTVHHFSSDIVKFGNLHIAQAT